MVMIETVQHVLEKTLHLHRNAPFVVGVSGGPDSVSLLDVLHRLGYPVVAAHFNHRLRSQAAADAQSAERFASTLGIPFTLGEGDVARLADMNMLSIEEAARAARYRFLFGEARRLNAQAVVVGHTADDQVETVMMHLIRGTGMTGLKGMTYRSIIPEWDDMIPLVRPLLDIWRSEIDTYCRERGLEPVTDQSNLDVVYFRNRLRHELIPLLESYQPGFRKTISRMTKVLSEEDTLLEEIAAAAWNDCMTEQSADLLAFSLKGLYALQPAVLRRLFRRAIQLLRPNYRDLDFETIERACTFLERPPATRQINLAAGLRLKIETGSLYLADWQALLPQGEYPTISPMQPLRFDVPGEVALSNDWVLSAECLDLTPDCFSIALANPDPFTAWLDWDCLSLPLWVRSRRPGDRFYPLGMDGRSQKLSDFFVNSKLPERFRSAYPLVFSSDELVWIPGLRMAHSVRVTARTARLACLVLKRSSSVD
jgi:tRNA(Ile)-lysidine synthase